MPVIWPGTKQIGDLETVSRISCVDMPISPVDAACDEWNFKHEESGKIPSSTSRLIAGLVGDDVGVRFPYIIAIEDCRVADLKGRAASLAPPAKPIRALLRSRRARSDAPYCPSIVEPTWRRL